MHFSAFAFSDIILCSSNMCTCMHAMRTHTHTRWPVIKCGAPSCRWTDALGQSLYAIVRRFSGHPSPRAYYSTIARHSQCSRVDCCPTCSASLWSLMSPTQQLQVGPLESSFALRRTSRATAGRSGASIGHLLVESDGLQIAAT